MDTASHVPSKDVDEERRASAGAAGPGPGSRSASPAESRGALSASSVQPHVAPMHGGTGYAMFKEPHIAEAPGAAPDQEPALISTNFHRNFKEAEEPDVVVVHVRAGSEYQAMLYLLRSVSRHFRMDDILPDVPEHIASHRYQILRPATGANPEGDATTFFQTPLIPKDLLLRRMQADVAEAKPSTWEIVLAPRPESPPQGSDGTCSLGDPADDAPVDPYLPGPDDFAAAGEAGDGAVPRLSALGSKPATPGLGGGTQHTTLTLPAEGARASGGGARGASLTRHAAAGARDSSPPLSDRPAISEEAEALAADVEALLGPEEADKVRAAAAELVARRSGSGSGSGASGASSQRQRGGVTGAASMSTNQARAWVRLAVQKMHEAPLQKPYLVPLAMPNQSGYLQMAAEAVMAFNKRGLLLTPYLDATCAAVACAVKIQAAWRAHSMGKRVSLREALVARRAAVTIQRAWRACLLRMRLDLLSKMRLVQRRLSCLQLDQLGVTTLALSVRGCEVLRERLTLPLSLFPEHDLRYVFSDEGLVHLVVRPLSEERVGLPLWAAPELRVVGQGEVEELFGPRQVYDQRGALVLLLQAATWKDAAGNELPREKGLPEPPPGAKSDDVLLQVAFSSTQEAAMRAALLLGLTYDPKYGFGAALVPLSGTNIARAMPTPAESRAMSPSSEMAMHRWSSLNGASVSSSWHQRTSVWPPTAGSCARTGGLSPPRSAVHSLVSEAPLPDWATPPLSRLGSPTKPVSPLQNSRGSRMGTSPGRGGHTGLGSLPASPQGTTGSRAGPAWRDGSPDLLRPAGSRPFGKPPSSRTMLPPLGRSGGARSMRGGSVPAPPQPLSQQFGFGSGTAAEFRPGTAAPCLMQGTATGDGTSSLPMGARPNTAAAAVAGGDAGATAAAGGVGLGAGSPSRRASAHPSRAGSIHSRAAGGDEPSLEPGKAHGSRPPSREEAEILQQRGSKGAPAGQWDGLADPSQQQGQPRQSVADSLLHVGPWQSDDSTLMRSEPWELRTPRRGDRGGESQSQGDMSPRGGTRGQQGSGSSRVLGASGSRGPQLPPQFTAAALLSGQRSARWLRSGSVSPSGAASPVQDTAAGVGKGASSGAAAVAMDALMSDPRFGVLTPNTRLLARVETVVRVDQDVAQRGLPLQAMDQYSTYQVEAQSGSKREGSGGNWDTVAAGYEQQGQQFGYHPEPGWGPDQDPGPTSLVSTLVSKAAPARYSSRPMPTEPVVRTVDVIKAAKAEQSKLNIFTLGGPATIARAVAGVVSPPRRPFIPTSVADRPLDQTRSCDQPVGAPAGPPPSDIPPLIVKEQPVLAVYLPDYVDDLAVQQASLLREDGYAAEEAVAIARDRHIQALRARGKELTQSGLLWVKHTGTGHSFAPDYKPLSTLAMAKLVAEMRAVYRAASVEQAAAQRTDHTAVMTELTQEKEEARKAAALANQRQAGVIKTLNSVFKEEWSKGVQGLVTRRGIRNEVRARAARDHAFAAAFGRQVALLGRNVRRGELSVVKTTGHAHAYAHTQQRHAEGEARHAAVAAAKSELTDVAKWKAATIRATGFTQEVKAYQEAADAFNRDVVALRRLEELERSQKVGPAGGVWGGAVPREVIREPLHMCAVGSVADAKRRRRKKKRQQQQQLLQGGGGDAATVAAAVGAEGVMSEPPSSRAAAAAAAAQGNPGQQPLRTPPRTPPGGADNLQTAQSPTGSRPGSRQNPNSRPGSRGGVPRVLGASGAVPSLLPAIPGASPRPQGSRVPSAQQYSTAGSGMYSGSYCSGAVTGSEYSEDGHSSGYDSSYSSSYLTGQGQEGVAGGGAKTGTAVARSGNTSRVRTGMGTQQGSERGGEEDENEEGSEMSEGEESHLTDYLPEMPYAHGARVPVLSKHRKPTGIVV